MLPCIVPKLAASLLTIDHLYNYTDICFVVICSPYKTIRFIKTYHMSQMEVSDQHESPQQCVLDGIFNKILLHEKDAYL